MSQSTKDAVEVREAFKAVIAELRSMGFEKAQGSMNQRISSGDFYSMARELQMILDKNYREI